MIVAVSHSLNSLRYERFCSGVQESNCRFTSSQNRSRSYRRMASSAILLIGLLLSFDIDLSVA